MVLVAVIILLIGVCVWGIFGYWVYEVSADTELDERARSLIIFHYYNGATLKSIADDMNMSYANAKVIHKKALRSLQAALSENL